MIVLGPAAAQAQYRNVSFGFDVGGWFISRPSIIDSSNNVFTGDDLPIRPFGGLRIGGESAFKIADEHFWFVPRLNVGMMWFRSGGTNSRTDQFDQNAIDTVGTVLGLQGILGLRYYILTDRIRPYVQLGVSYQRLFGFESKSNDTCTDPVLCPNGETNGDVFLRHRNIGGVHIETGLEMIVVRDFAIRVFADVQRWLVINAADNYSGVLGVGAVFFI